MLKRVFIFVFLLFGSSAFLFSQQTQPLKSTIVTIKDCKACSTELTEKFLRSIFQNLDFKKIDYKEKEAQGLIKTLKPKTLPLFIFGLDIESEANFPKLNKLLVKKDALYMLKPELSGIFYFLDRPLISKRIDLFVNLYDDQAASILKSIKQKAGREGLTLELHFIFNKDNKPEVEEVLRILSVKHLYPGKFWEYLFNRLQNIRSSFWNIALQRLGVDIDKIVDFSLSQKAAKLLEENRSLTQELEIRQSSVILVNNRQIFNIVSSSQPLDDLLERLE
ncbi:MAG: hypothetical protein JW734_06325 [Candidatus Omnitrophica bacterium]|nr:hypothetical protein [Candidatus Omnitrophota bacterium]